MELVHEAGVFNASVYRGFRDGREVIEKDFSHCPWWMRNTLGRILIRREVSVLRAVGAVTPAVPGHAERLSAYRLSESFVSGRTVKDYSDTAWHNWLSLPENERCPRQEIASGIPVAFFRRLVREIRSVHHAGWVHLDLHNPGNILVNDAGDPVMLDWQSAIRTRYFPGFMRRLMEAIDLAGAFKHWNHNCPGTLSPRQARFLVSMRSMRRRFWFPRIHIVRKK